MLLMVNASLQGEKRGFAPPTRPQQIRQRRCVIGRLMLNSDSLRPMIHTHILLVVSCDLNAFLSPPPTPVTRLTAGTELKFICCGWFMGEAARAPIGAWDIWALGRAMWLNWFIPGQKSGPQRSAAHTHQHFLRYIFFVPYDELFHVSNHKGPIRE